MLSWGGVGGPPQLQDLCRGEVGGKGAGTASSQKPCSRSFLKHVQEPSSGVFRGWAAVRSQLGVSWGRCISAQGWQKWSQDPAPFPLASPEPVSRPCYLLNCFAMYSLYFGKKKKMAFAWCVVERVFSPPALPPPCPSLGLFVLIISNPRDSLVLCSLFFSVLVGFVHLSVVCLCLSINPRIKVPLDFSIPVWDIKKKIKKNWIPNQCPEREEPSWLDPGFVAGSAGSPGGGVWWRRGWSVAWWAGLRAGYPARSDFGPWVGTGSGRGGVARGGVGGSSPAQRCPRVLRCRVAGRRRSRSHGYRQGVGREPGGPGATSALLARALSGRRRPLGDGGSRVTCQELPFPASSAMCPGHVSRALWA